MKFRYTILALFSLSLLSCTDGFENDNRNPNNPEFVPTYGLYNSATRDLVGITTRGSFGSARMTLPWVQYSAQLTYTEEDRYEYRRDTPLSIFNNYYRQANNFKKIIETVENPEQSDITATYGNNDVQIAVSRIMIVYTFQQLVDMFGDVPYWSYGNKNPDFQALDIDIISPKYATQEDIYTDLLNELKEAIAVLDNSNETNIFYTTETYIGDNLFDNDVEKLKKFANSLRLRIATRIKNTSLSSVATTHIAEAITSGVMTSNNDSVGVTYEDNSVNPAPQYAAFFIDNRTDYTVSKTFVDLLKGQIAPSLTMVDPRLQKVVAPKGVGKQNSLLNKYTPVYSTIADTLDKYYQGMPFGIPNSLAISQKGNSRQYISMYSNAIFKPNYTEYLMEYAEVEFLLAEANGWNQANYEAGVRASMQKWGVDQADITAYVTTLPAASQENVLNQKYIALFMQPYEAWSEYRRTGFPNFLIKPGDPIALINPINGSDTYIFQITATARSINGNMTDLPGRIRYPYTEETLNRTNYKAAVDRMGGDTMQQTLIWDRNH